MSTREETRGQQIVYRADVAWSLRRPGVAGGRIGLASQIPLLEALFSIGAFQFTAGFELACTFTSECQGIVGEQIAARNSVSVLKMESDFEWPWVFGSSDEVT